VVSRSPLAPSRFAKLPEVPGVRIGTRSCGLNNFGRDDVMMVEFNSGTAVAGVMTRSLTAAAPVEWCRGALPKGRARALVVNSGNANAFTGKAGTKSVERSVTAAAKLVRCEHHEVFVASTGVIGEPLADDKITEAMADLYGSLAPNSWDQAAKSIMTTDTFSKSATCTAKIGDTEIIINGIAKGSGMIAPNMATMLAFVFTNAALSATVLQPLLEDANRRSFNSITVDGDTSTNDTVLVFATGKARHNEIVSHHDAALAEFRTALNWIMVDLAKQIVRDGEGASKFVTIAVTGADSEHAARIIGLAVANSPLVKTAIAGEDANWGRIVMAVGKAGEHIDRDRIKITIGGHTITQDGQVRPGFDETPVTEHMKGQEISIDIDVGVGRGHWTVWTCDLTHGYIDINADYRS